jgi:hypothetical protein
MARARNIKPSLFKNEVLGVADPLLTILFTSLWCLADKKGRLEDRPLRIKAETFPYRENIDINRYLTELSQLGFIHRYKVNEIGYIQVINFDKHQNPHHTEKDSEYPEYSIGCDLTVSTPLSNSYTPADSLIPDSLNTDSLIPLTLTTDSLIVVAADKSAPAPKDTELQSACKSTWKAYSDAYFDRYGTEPVRNAKVNSQVKSFVQRLGFLESPSVASFFVGHNNAYYAGRMHSIDCLLADAEKLRTEWATGNAMTHTKAKQIDRKQNNLDAVGEAMKLLEGGN